MLQPTDHQPTKQTHFKCGRRRSFYVLCVSTKPNIMCGRVHSAHKTYYNKTYLQINILHKINIK